MVPLSPAVSEPAEPAAGVCPARPVGTHESPPLLSRSIHLDSVPIQASSAEPLTPEAERRPREAAGLLATVDPGGPLEVDIFVIQPLF